MYDSKMYKNFINVLKRFFHFQFNWKKSQNMLQIIMKIAHRTTRQAAPPFLITVLTPIQETIKQHYEILISKYVIIKAGVEPVFC